MPHFQHPTTSIWVAALAAALLMVARAQGLDVALGPVTNPAVYASRGVVECLVQAESAGNGVVAGHTNDWVEVGSNATVAATPAEYYDLDRWEDGSAATVRVFVVSGPTNLTAYFKKRLDADGVAEDWKADNLITNVWEDTDKDGALDIEEYFADTNPNRDDDYFRVVRQAGAGSEQAGFPGTSTNCEYDILGSRDLRDDGWDSLTNFPGTGAPVYIDPDIGVGPRFIGGKVRRVNP